MAWGAFKGVDPKMIRTASLATLIPVMMGVGPLMGYLIGDWAGAKLGNQSAGALIGLAIGLAAGMRESYLLIRRVIAQTKENEGR